MSFLVQIDDDAVVQRPLLNPPPATAHKYDRGHSLIFSGPALKTGASRLSAQAALAVGSGLVTIVGDKEALREQAAHVTAIMLHRRSEELQSIDSRISAFAIGPGYGVNAATRRDVLSLAGQGRAMVLDADGLTAFEEDNSALFTAAHSQMVMTPHAGEFARLFPDMDMEDRTRAAIKGAAEAGSVLLLKGAETVIAAPDGRYAVNRHASGWLATAGSGDVLTGLICGIMAQGIGAFRAACCASWIHGDIAIRHGAGLTADRMIDIIPAVLQDCLAPTGEGE